ncbi:hypothetical protein PX699_17675 [Sphingobium sp. H39-3-25]|uniref:hypothetical protein n=1 Tax=Sphingobium arseniciresistens TaxID=3030834 RepID=UPI0023B8A4D6|nr:hypothetical protein [Sphingobium arseniciresistens]
MPADRGGRHALCREQREAVHCLRCPWSSVAHGDSGGRGTYAADEPLGTVSAGGNAHAVAAPGIVPITHTSSDWPAHSVEEPLRTVTTAKGGELATTAASLVKLRNHSDGEDPTAPLGTVTWGGLHHGVAEAIMVPHINTNRNAQKPYTAADEPTHTITAEGAYQNVVSAFLHRYRQNSTGAPMDCPAPTVTANSFVKKSGGAAPISLVSAHLEQANGGGVIGHDAHEPCLPSRRQVRSSASSRRR